MMPGYAPREMSLDEYQAAALRTARSDHATLIERFLAEAFGGAGLVPVVVREAVAARRIKSLALANWSLGVAGEAGEYADLMKKAIFHGHAIDREKAKKELGDVLWYVAVAAHEHGIPLAEVAEANIAKLRARYPEAFSESDSQARRDVADDVATPDQGAVLAQARRVVQVHNDAAPAFKAPVPPWWNDGLCPKCGAPGARIVDPHDREDALSCQSPGCRVETFLVETSSGAGRDGGTSR